VPCRKACVNSGRMAADVRASLPVVARRPGAAGRRIDGIWTTASPKVADVISRRVTSWQYVKHRISGPELASRRDLTELPDRIGVSICKDLDFPSLPAATRGRTGLLLVPAGTSARCPAPREWLAARVKGISWPAAPRKPAERHRQQGRSRCGIGEQEGGARCCSPPACARSGNTIYARTGTFRPCVRPPLAA